jgi:5-methyltetrahydrofolate corrinoid/iron sulfur protein methyltransferase
MLLAADNVQGLNLVVAEAMQRLDPEPVRELVRRCERAGAQLIDINPGYLSRRNEDRMAFLVETVQEATSLPLILDSPNPRILARGLSVCRDKPILNALSKEPEKLDAILPLAVEHQTELVILLMDERSFTPPSIEEKLALALELREHAISAGVDPERLIFDPVLPNFSWDDAVFRVAEDIKIVRLLATGAVFQDPARTMVGLSNLRSGARSRYPFQQEETCLKLLAGAGLHMALANVLQTGLSGVWRSMEPYM